MLIRTFDILNIINMVTIDIDETTVLGKRILLEIAENHQIGQVKDFEIPLDKNGVPIGTPWEEVLEEMYNELSEHYGVDLRTL
jgi:ABC-type nitrate/sulfonate/bicarbonate transport system ATPase subunit